MIFHFHQRWEGALWKTVSSVSFAVMAILLKYSLLLSESTSVLWVQIIFLENVFGSCFILLPQIKKLHLKPNLLRFDLHALRIFFASAGVLLWAYALYRLPLSLALALSFTGPAITLIVARIVLKESLTPLRLLAIFFGLLGAGLILRPDHKFIVGLTHLEHHQNLYVVLPLLSTFSIACTKVISRFMATKGESPVTMSTYLLLSMIPITGALALPYWTQMTSLQLGLSVFAGFFAALAHWSVAKAYSLASIPFLTPFGFARVIVGSTLAFLIFDETVLGLTFYYGVCAIFVSVLILAWSERVEKH